MRNLNMYRWKRRRFWKRQIPWLPCLLEVRISVPLFSDVYLMYLRFKNFWAVRSLKSFSIRVWCVCFHFLSRVPSPFFPGNISDGLLTWDPAVMISAEPSGPEIWLGFPTKWTIYTTIKTHNMTTCYICRCIYWTHCEDNMWRHLKMLEDVKDEEVCRVELTNHDSLSLIANLCEMHILKCSIFVTNNRETNCERTCSSFFACCRACSFLKHAVALATLPHQGA